MYFVNSVVVLSPPISLVFTPDLTKSNIANFKSSGVLV